MREELRNQKCKCHFPLKVSRAVQTFIFLIENLQNSFSSIIHYGHYFVITIILQRLKSVPSIENFHNNRMLARHK